MRHYLLLKLKDAAAVPQFAAGAREIFSELLSAGIGVEAVRVYENFVDRPDNLDILVEFDMRDARTLEDYISHPIHLRFIEYAVPLVEKKISFDAEA